MEVEKKINIEDSNDLGNIAGRELLENDEAKKIIYGIRNAK